MVNLTTAIPLPTSKDAVGLAQALEGLVQSDYFQEAIEAHPGIALSLFSEHLFFHVPSSSQQLQVACASFVEIWERVRTHSERMPHAQPEGNPRLQVAHDVLNDVSVQLCVQTLSSVTSVENFQNLRMHLKALVEYLARDRVFYAASSAFLRD